MDVLSLRLFIRIVERGVISAAAHDLKLSPASASVRLARLEDLVGIRLFNRTTRAVSLTTDGAVFLPYAQQLIETLDLGLSAIGGEGPEAQGLLRMTMPGSFGRMYILPILHQFHERHPNVSLDLRLSDEILNVVEGAYDLILRNAPLNDSSFIARKLASDRRLLVASPSYIERHGAPSSPEELKEHHCVTFADSNRWSFENGEVLTIKPAFSVNDGEAMRFMVEQGLGLGLKSVWNVSDSLKSGLLQEVMPDCKPMTTSSIWILYPSNRIVAPKVRAMIDFLLEQFNPIPPWEKSEDECQ